MSRYTPLELAEAFIQAGELVDALTALDEHLAAHPADVEARRLRASVRLRLDDPAGARDDLAALETLNRDDHLTRLTIFERLDDSSGLAGAMQAAYTAYPDDPRVVERYLHLLQAQGDLKTARAVAAAQPATWRWDVWRGDLARADGDLSTAIAAYTAALSALAAAYAIDTERPARVLAGATSEAIALTVAGEYARLRLARAGVYVDLQDDAQADADYAVAGVLLPDDMTIPFNRGLIAWRQGDHPRARSLMQAALAGASAAMRARLRANLPDGADDIGN
jgi:hypothetical protein